MEQARLDLLEIMSPEKLREGFKILYDFIDQQTAYIDDLNSLVDRLEGMNKTQSKYIKLLEAQCSSENK